MSRIRLLLVDDHQVVRAGLRMLFQAEKDMEIVGEVGSGKAGKAEVEARGIHLQSQGDLVEIQPACIGIYGIWN